MSGINFDPSRNNLNYIDSQRGVAQGARDTAQTNANGQRDSWNNAGYVDSNGKPLKFDTLQGWQDAIANHQVFHAGTPPKAIGQSDEGLMLGKNAPFLTALNDANAKVALLERFSTNMKESMDGVEQMKRLLDTGDIEGAVMLLQTSRAKVLEAQLGTRIEGMQARNNAIRAKNDDLAQKQNDLAGLTGDDKKAAYQSKQAEITKAKGELDALNSESQLDMIGIQGLVNKRNEAFDTLTNLLGKFQKTIDGIVGNYR